MALILTMTFAAPNVYQVMRRWRPALETFRDSSTSPLEFSFRWSYAIGICLLGAITLIRLTGSSEFLYFNF